MPAWQLPDQISDILPAEAARLERLRRRLLDLYGRYGYDLVQPPLIEHLESLMVDQARDLDLRTFKVVDQGSGRLLGLRADITPGGATRCPSDSKQGRHSALLCGLSAACAACGAAVIARAGAGGV